NLPAWLYRIAVRQVRDFRRLRWIRNIFKRSVPLSNRLVSPAPTPAMAFETREKQRLLERLLAELSEPMRATFVLFEIEGYTSEEIAALHKVSINTVRARIFRARTKLLGLLKNEVDNVLVNAKWKTDTTTQKKRRKSDGAAQLLRTTSSARTRMATP
ncbi:MAG TPA: RNA polymerase sigma factor, partial [Polyangia bacterium]|nr:RNA polymerase sigma factor [Polyangia bacterium]